MALSYTVRYCGIPSGEGLRNDRSAMRTETAREQNTGSSASVFRVALRERPILAHLQLLLLAALCGWLLNTCNRDSRMGGPTFVRHHVLSFNSFPSCLDLHLTRSELYIQ